MKTPLKQIAGLCLFFISTCQLNAAMHLSHTNQGQAIIFPYFSVANGLHTYFSINNHTGAAKAIKVNIREAKGSPMYSFNLYLSAHDIWTLALGTENGFITSLTFDQSCVLNYNNPDPSAANSWEWQTGLIEVIEMGNFTDTDNTFFSANGEANADSCPQIASAWESGGVWETNTNTDLSAVSGGLTGQVSVIDVANGFTFQVPPTIIKDFFPAGSIKHFPPTSALPDLNSGTKNSLVIHKGAAITTQWPTGYEAVSALLMKTQTENEFNIAPTVNGKSEWIISFPTLNYHLANSQTSKPFTRVNSTDSDNIFVFSDRNNFLNLMFDREGNNYYTYYAGDPVPPLLATTFNSAVNTQVITQNPVVEGGQISTTSTISGEARDNVKTTVLSYLAGSPGLEDVVSGKIVERMIYTVNDRGVNSTTLQQQYYHGLPFVAFSYYQYTNGNAAPGLLAKYANAQLNHSEVKIESEASSN